MQPSGSRLTTGTAGGKRELMRRPTGCYRTRRRGHFSGPPHAERLVWNLDSRRLDKQAAGQGACPRPTRCFVQASALRDQSPLPGGCSPPIPPEKRLRPLYKMGGRPNNCGKHVFSETLPKAAQTTRRWVFDSPTSSKAGTRCQCHKKRDTQEPGRPSAPSSGQIWRRHPDRVDCIGWAGGYTMVCQGKIQW